MTEERLSEVATAWEEYRILREEENDARERWRRSYRRFWISLAFAAFFTGVVIGISLRGI